MRSKTTKVRMGDGYERVTVLLQSESCQPDSMESKLIQLQILRGLTDNPELFNCGFVTFQKLRMFHDGEFWNIEMQADQPDLQR